MLLLKKHLVRLVREGKKRQTIRLWTRAMLRAGQVSYTPGLGRMRITAVDEIGALEELTEEDAVADGFGDLAGLLLEIRKIYGAKPEGRRIFRIRFKWPIDGAGRALVLKGAERAVVKSKARREDGRRIGRKDAGGEEAGLRRRLHAYIVSRAPGRAGR